MTNASTETVRGYRPILHIHVTDGLTGKLLVDVDSPSVAHGLAYYLSSRRIDEAATETSVTDDVRRVGEPAGPTSRMIRQTRNAFTQALEMSLDAHVEGDPGAIHYCPGCKAAEPRVKRCSCGWAVELKGGRWLHVQTGRHDCPTPAETSGWAV